METIYLNLDARRVTVCEGAQDQKACVGQETVCYTVLPRHKPARPEGKAPRPADLDNPYGPCYTRARSFDQLRGKNKPKP